MTTVRRSTSNVDTPSPEPLPQRWGLILTAAAMAGLVGFMAGGPIVALVAASGAVGLLHKVMA
ncbi:hypothetical protein ACWD01_23430 [Streptomyces sp. NPDC002835]